MHSGIDPEMLEYNPHQLIWGNYAFKTAYYAQ